MPAIYHKRGTLDEHYRLRYSNAPSAAVSNLPRMLSRVKNDCRSLASLACIAAGKECPMARKLSIALAVVLAIFVASPNFGLAQGRGGGFHGGGFHGGGVGFHGGGFHGGGFGFHGGGGFRGGGWGWRGGGWGWCGGC